MQRIEELYTLYLNGTITPAEKQELFECLDQADDSRLIRLADQYFYQEAPENLDHLQAHSEQLLQQIKQRMALTETGRKDRKLWTLLRYTGTAAAILFIVFFIYRYNTTNVTQNTSQTVQVGADVPPGTNRATLTLNNGKTLVLSEKMEGIRVKDGHILYDNGDLLVNGTTVQQVTMTVPRGGKYKLELADGTRVWLNAATSLTYPSAFTGAERIVEVNGEAYFEVQHDSKHPFIVKSGTQTIRVLGTAFNLNTYRHEKAITTLVNGQIALRTGKGDEKILAPGDQAVNNGQAITLSKVLTQDYTAWKDDLIVLHDQDLSDIFKQLERWYDVEFVNTEQLGTRTTLSGEIPRNTNLSAILQALEEQAHVKFEMKGRRIMVRN